MDNPPPAVPAKGKVPGVVIGLLILVVVCVVIPCCIFVVLYTLRPVVGNVFSELVATLEAPIP